MTFSRINSPTFREPPASRVREKQVWKFELERTSEILMPKGAVILSCAVQNGGAFIWALVDPDEEQTMRRFECFGTGRPIPIPFPTLCFVGTVFFENGLVFHVFEVEVSRERGERT